MKIEVKTLADLQQYESGVVARTFERDLQTLLGDLHDRPGLAKARSLSLKLELTPVADDSGGLAEVKVDISLSMSQPASKTRTVNARAVGSKGFVYEDLSPDNVNQLTLDGELGKAVKK